MKKFLCTLAAFMAIAVGSRADEGMWLLPLIQQMNEGAMTQLGSRLTAEQIYSINNSSLKDAIVIFGGGCTGEMISDEGLLVTNHHCGYGTIQRLSTPEHNYLEDGYWAMNRSEELPAPGLFVVYLQYMQDVTDILQKAYDEALSANKKADDKEAIAEKARHDKEEEVLASIREDWPHCEAIVESFYSENVYYVIVYKIYQDVRFVGAPPASMGKFGGEADNWEWPRHTCDFSMFRVYAGPDNEPASYSEENVPYRPKQSLKVSLRGVKEGDFAFIMGYPGSTQRFQTAAQMQDMIDANDVRVAARTVRQNVMWAGMESDPAIRLQYASKYSGSSNGWKKWQGQKQSFADLDIIAREEQKEAEFMAWVNADKKRVEKYGNAIGDINGVVEGRADAKKAQYYISESLSTISPVQSASTLTSSLSRPMGGPGRSMIRGGGQPPMGGPAPKVDTLQAIKMATERLMSGFRDYNDPLERQMAVAMINFYRDNACPENYPQLEDADFATMDVEAFVNKLFDESAFTSPEKLQNAGLEILNDPAVKFANAISAVLNPLRIAANAGAEKLNEGNHALTAGLLEWKAGEPSYPDANFTMRLTYGNVLPYSPKDGVTYWYYTTLDGVIEKEDPNDYEFHVPAKLKEIYEAKDFGEYVNEDGKVPACFLTNCDITGGNSGSPVMDADGCLIGLAFDGNWESMSSDVMFEPALQRCICVDIRYVLLAMDKVGGAGYLLDEMNLVRQ